MEFELTDSVYSKILFAMEDQTQVHVLNTETLELEAFDSIEKKLLKNMLNFLSGQAQKVFHSWKISQMLCILL